MTNKEKIITALGLAYCHKIEDLNKKTNLSLFRLREELDNLVSEEIVYKKGDNYYLYKKGIIEVKDKGFAFIKVEGEELDYYVAETDVFGAFSGDEVGFYILPKIGTQKLDSAIVVKVITRSKDKIYGKLIEKKNKLGVSYMVISHDSKFDIKANVKEKDLNGAVADSIVVAKITKYAGSKSEAVIERVVGHKDDPGVDISLIALQYGFELEFLDDAMKQAIDTPIEVKLEDYPNRRDFTNEVIMTIDGEEAKDFDDAVNVKVLENGNYQLGVYIADVSEYVTHGSPLDVEALKRGTSVYLADRVIPMLPHKLSNGICSLNEGVNRLTLCCIMEIDQKGNLVNYDICEGVIKSKHRMTYTKINKILDGDKELIAEYSDIYDSIINMHELSKIIRDRRTKKGALDFDAPEFKISLNDKGEPTEFVLRTRGEGELLIEDFMLTANETIAYHMDIMHLPCVYRVHEAPEEERLEQTFTFMRNLGLTVKNVKKIVPKVIQEVMNDVKGKPEYYIVNQMMLRSMMKAKYDPKNLGHYGLAFQYYCHFTSPIRRYPDLMVHRLIKELLINPRNFDDDMMYYNSILNEVSLRSSVQERKAVECERDVNDMLMAMYMSNYIGEKYEGIINSITSFGMFVTLTNGIEGLVHVTNMSGYYAFNEKNMTLSSSKKTYKVGDKVNIVVYNTDRKERRVDFILEKDHNTFNGEEYEGNIRK